MVSQVSEFVSLVQSVDSVLMQRIAAAVRDYNVSAVQAIMLYRLGTGRVEAGDIRSRGYYMGSNSSYNLAQLESLGFIRRDGDKTDKRVLFVTATQKGLDVARLVEAEYKDMAGLYDGYGLLNSELRLIHRQLTNTDNNA